MKKAVIVGIFGQDGQFLCNHLEKNGYVVTGIGRNKVYSSNQSWDKLIDIGEKDDVAYLIKKLQPDEIYYLAACHHSSEDIKEDFSQLLKSSYLVNVFSYINFLESIVEYSKTTRIFYAASSHIYGDSIEEIQDETTKFSPISIYGITKLDGLLLSRYFRSKHRLHSSVGILYNHESHLRHPNFVSRKIVKAAVEIKKGIRDELILGDLNAQIDWGYAGDYVDAMYQIVNHKEPEDYIIASGKIIELVDFVQIVFRELGITWRKFVKEDKSLLKRIFTATYCGNPAKLISATGWKPTTDLDDLAKIMVKKELERNK